MRKLISTAVFWWKLRGREGGQRRGKGNGRGRGDVAIYRSSNDKPQFNVIYYSNRLGYARFG